MRLSFPRHLLWYLWLHRPCLLLVLMRLLVCLHSHLCPYDIRDLRGGALWLRCAGLWHFIPRARRRVVAGRHFWDLIPADQRSAAMCMEIVFCRQPLTRNSFETTSCPCQPWLASHEGRRWSDRGTPAEQTHPHPRLHPCFSTQTPTHLLSTAMMMLSVRRHCAASAAFTRCTVGMGATAPAGPPAAALAKAV